MGRLRDFFGFGTTPAVVNNELDLASIVDRYDVLSVEPGRGVAFGEGQSAYIVVAERPRGSINRYPGNGMINAAQYGIDLSEINTAGPSIAEFGTASPSPFSSWMRQEYNRQLQGLSGLQKYDQMRRSDGTVRGTLRAFKTPVLAGRWFIEPASDKKADKNAAELTWKALNSMSITWTQFLTEALLMADFGYYMFEKVWEERKIDGKNLLTWKKLAPRHPMDVKKWHLDAKGGPAGVTMYADSTEPLAGEVDIPIDKLLVFSFDKEASNIEGISVLRSAYKHWFYKEQLYKIDAIQKERHGIGIPVIKLPLNFTTEDKTAADELGRNLRTNERAHVVLPPNWELLFAKLEGNIVNALESADHHDARIRENVMASFLGDAKTTKEEDQTMFLQGARFTADLIQDTINAYCIPQFIDYNFNRVGYPKLHARRIGEAERQRTLSFTLRNLVGAKIIIPDRRLEDFTRNELDLPPVDEETREEYEQRLQGANKANGPDSPGLPRQKATPEAKPPAKNAGTDQSGTSKTK